MTTSLKVLGGGRGAALSVATEHALVVRDNLIDATVDAIIDDLMAMFPTVIFTNNDGIHATNLTHASINFLCGIYTADNEHLNITAQDGHLHLKISSRVLESSILLIWLMLQRIVDQYRIITENTLLIMNTPEHKLGELIGC